MEIWKPGMLIQDDADIAYEPQDKEGKRIAAYIALELKLIGWRVKMQTPKYDGPYQTFNCRCIVKPLKD